MIKTLQEIKEAAASLSAEERAELAAFVLRSLDGLTNRSTKTQSAKSGLP